MKKEFPEESYLEANPDVKEAVVNGQFRNGKHHYDGFGKNENRKGLDEWEMS